MRFILLKLTNSHTYTLTNLLYCVSHHERLQLLNTTVASIALFVNSVLTQTYHAIYGSGGDEEELILVVAPLAANKEIEDLYKANLIDFESAMPAALHSLGCSAEEIASAMQRRRDAEAQEKAMNDEREKTERAELKARAKLAANPPPVQATSTAKAPAAPKPAAPKPQSDTD